MIWRTWRWRPRVEPGTPRCSRPCSSGCRASDDSNVRERLLGALAQFPDPALAEQARGLAMQEELRVNERGYVLAGQISTFEQRRAAWKWVQKNVDDYAPRMPETYVQFLAYAQDGCSEADAQELQSSLAPHIGRFAGATYTLNKVAEKTRLCGALADRQRESARQFFHRRTRRRGAPPATARPSTDRRRTRRPT